MSGHFTLDVDPGLLDTAATGLTGLAEDLGTRAGEVEDTPAQISPRDWSGAARTAITTEMSGLGRELRRFAPLFTTAAAALTTAAAAARTAEDTTLPSLNNRWDGARTTYSGDVGKARTQYDQQVADVDPAVTGTARTATLSGLDQVRQQAVAAAAETRRLTEAGLDREYAALVSDLQAAFRSASTALADATAVAVPDQTVTDFVARGGSGLVVGWCTPDGRTFPPELGADRALAGSLTLLDDRHAVLDGERVAGYLRTWEGNDDRPPPSIDPEVAALIRERGNDPLFGQTVATQLGPQGVVRILQKASGLLGTPGLSPDWHYADDPPAERERLVAIQDTLAGGLALVVAAGSRAPGGLPNYGRQIVEQDPKVAGLLFRYADRQNASFGGPFMREAGNALREREENDPLIWSALYGNDTIGFGSDPKREDADPMVWFLRAADNSVESAQGVMGDRALMTHLLINQWDRFGSDDQAGNVLRVASTDFAREPVPPGTDPRQSVAWRSAEISSLALDVAGEGAEPVDGVREELAGIVATYMPDVDRAFKNPDVGGPGVYDHSSGTWPPGVLPSDNWPQFGIRIDNGDLRDVIGDVGDSEAGRKLVAQTATAYNQIRLDRGGADAVGWSGSDDSPFLVAAHESTQLQGFLVDALALGDIEGAKEEAERKKMVAELFLLPVDFIPTDKAGPVAPLADFVLDQVKEGVTDAYVGDGVSVAYGGANDDWDASRQTLKLQVLESARVNGLLPSADAAAWPRDSRGQMIPVSELGDETRARVVQDISGDSGPVGDAIRAIENGYDNYDQQYTE